MLQILYVPLVNSDHPKATSACPTYFYFLSFVCPGLDFPQIQHVINYDMPEDIENYVHRIGRTGRGKDKGRATTLINKSVDSAGMLTEIQLWTNFLFIYNSSQC